MNESSVVDELKSIFGRLNQHLKPMSLEVRSVLGTVQDPETDAIQRMLYHGIINTVSTLSYLQYRK